MESNFGDETPCIVRTRHNRERLYVMIRGRKLCQAQPCVFGSAPTERENLFVSLVQFMFVLLFFLIRFCL